MMTDRERLKALEALERTRVDLLDAVSGVSEEDARWRPAAERWSILEYVEHLAVSDDALMALVRRALELPAAPETAEERKQREMGIRAAQSSGEVNRAPEALRPVGRFASLAEAVAAFEAARARTVEFARTTEADLRSHFAMHGLLGKLDAYQWMSGNAHHAATHAANIREVRALLAARS
jgi:hypothetical protein